MGHVAPEAFVGGTIALVQEGDMITIDARERLIRLDVSDEELARRRAKWQQPEPRYTTRTDGEVREARLDLEQRRHYGRLSLPPGASSI